MDPKSIPNGFVELSRHMSQSESVSLCLRHSSIESVCHAPLWSYDQSTKDGSQITLSSGNFFDVIETPDCVLNKIRWAAERDGIGNDQ